MPRGYHMGIGRDQLASWLMTQTTGEEVARPDLTGAQAADLVRQDRRLVLPCSPCPAWHPEHGCPGHEE